MLFLLPCPPVPAICSAPLRSVYGRYTKTPLLRDA